MQINFLMPVMIVVSFLAIYQKEAAPLKPIRTPVEVWCGGDDMLTRGVCYATENAFESAADFVPSYGKKAGTFVVTIPTHVKWKERGDRTKVSYTVEFTSIDDNRVGSHKGSCWDDDPVPDRIFRSRPFLHAQSISGLFTTQQTGGQ
ncbi:MAG: hypothetical protein QOF62_926 [Pyrinomonadaceae bacterium]|jgi:hypothetical protein|nr:hypothetical protein [Pyrinomonadaceae bacterium]